MDVLQFHGYSTKLTFSLSITTFLQIRGNSLLTYRLAWSSKIYTQPSGTIIECFVYFSTLHMLKILIHLYMQSTPSPRTRRMNWRYFYSNTFKLSFFQRTISIVPTTSKGHLIPLNSTLSASKKLEIWWNLSSPIYSHHTKLQNVARKLHLTSKELRNIPFLKCSCLTGHMNCCTTPLIAKSAPSHGGASCCLFTSNSSVTFTLHPN